jgi:hypothetical protein
MKAIESSLENMGIQSNKNKRNDKGSWKKKEDKDTEKY